MNIAQNLKQIKLKIAKAQKDKKVLLLAVSKTKSVAQINAAVQAGQRDFGENYLQEALEKIKTINDANIIWHFIGSIQSNKTKLISAKFDWVHTVDRLIIAKRLNEQRMDDLAKLNICIQVNVDNESNKSGVTVADLNDLINEVKNMQNLSLRGLMCIPNASNSKDAFNRLAKIKENYPFMDTLSMGMSNDFEDAIKAGSTIVRIGTDIFGKRNKIKKKF